jgi:tetratricopeptide (TPR) repeat protein
VAPTELSESRARGRRSGGLAPVIRLEPLAARQMGDSGRTRLEAVALLVAVAVALSPLWSGYYNFGAWAPLALGAVVLLVVVALAGRATLTRFGLTAGGALAVLLALSAASMLWAESGESAWTDTNQLALYVVVFAIGVLAIRERRSARTIALILGAPALLTAVVVTGAMISGHGQGAFLAGRLNSPMGYINGTAGLLVIGLWPWMALAETSPRKVVRAGSVAAAALIAGTAVLTQSRAIVPATLLATVLVLAAVPGRTRRTVHLVLVAIAIALSLHWTLDVYRSSGPIQVLALGDGVLRSAGLALLAGAVLVALAKLALSTVAERASARRRERAIRVLGRALLAAALAGVVALGVVGGPTLRRQYDTFTQNVADQAAPDRFLSGGGFRYDLWRVAVDEFRAHPLGGLGAGGYDDEYYRLRTNPQSVVVPHSLELQMAAELGVGGIAALIVFCGVVLAAGFARRRTLAARDPMVRIAALGMFTAWLTATSVDWLYDFPGLTGAALLAAALLTVPGEGGDAGAGMRPAGRRRLAQAALVGGLGVLALAAASIGRQYAASRYAASAAGQVDRAPTRALASLQTAERLDPYSLQTLYSIASAYAALDDYPDARAALVAAERREPDNYVPPALLGDLATRRGDYATALTSYELARRLDPHDPEVQSLVRAARVRARNTS